MKRLVAAMLLFASVAHADGVTVLTPIPLRPGVNAVPDLAPDGGAGLVVVGWRENGNAHGFHLIVVLVSDGGGGWNVVRVEGPVNDPGSDTISDDPHTGEDVVRAVRLAREEADGKASVLLLTATRDISPDIGIPNPSDVTFDTYRMVDQPRVGTTPVHFRLVERTKVGAHSCNAEMALSQWFHLPLPAGYEGPRTLDGCFTSPP